MVDLVLREKPTYGEPCNNCGICCIKVQCPLSLAIFDEQDICPALGMAEMGNFGCRLVENPQAFLPDIADDVAPIMSEYHALLIGAGAGCDGQGDDEPDPTPEQRDRVRQRAARFRKTASPEAVRLFEYATTPDTGGGHD
jgi:hypothetical protein